MGLCLSLLPAAKERGILSGL